MRGGWESQKEDELFLCWLSDPDTQRVLQEWMRQIQSEIKHLLVTLGSKGLRQDDFASFQQALPGAGAQDPATELSALFVRDFPRVHLPGCRTLTSNTGCFDWTPGTPTRQRRGAAWGCPRRPELYGAQRFTVPPPMRWTVLLKGTSARYEESP
ncbi:hypothetical protein STEG23_031621 [Scotinomys teguina]